MKIRRFAKDYDMGESEEDCICDVVYTDRTTGKEVLRYDGADPANYREDYGAVPDHLIFARKGLDINEMVEESACLPKWRLS